MCFSEQNMIFVSSTKLTERRGVGERERERERDGGEWEEREAKTERVGQRDRGGRDNER